ncbi:MAG: efflux transporter outer membrane subunit [Planctomycetes bacterium]|nr:efflux transporter outer membrane subunit [Planctomycetota bacterium]
MRCRLQTGAFALAALLAACSVGSDAPPPTFELPAATADVPLDLSHWWTRFDDPRLDDLIDRALANNQDLRAAQARVDEAAALARNVDDLLPLVDLRAGFGRSQTSDRSAFPRFPIVNRRNYTHSIGLDLAYEVDLWGRIRAGDRAALADLAADREALHAVQAGIAARTVEAWFRLVALDQRLRLLRRTGDNRRDALRIQQERRAAGTGTALEVHQAEADLAAIDVLLPRAEEALAAAARALAVLVGAQPREIAAPSTAHPDELPPPPAVPAGLPADLLQRRPDVRSAEAQLAATAARVTEARARYYPTIRLSGSFGQESQDLRDLFIGPATVWNLAGGLTQPLFGIRKLDAQFDSAEARRLAAEATYAKTVQEAFAETLDALGSLAATNRTIDALDRRVAALTESERVASARHGAGAGSFLDLLDARRNRLGAENERIDARLDALLGTIAVFRALGGGFDDR